MFEQGAVRIVNGIGAQSVICEICTVVKRSGLLDLIYEIVTSENSNGKHAYDHVKFEISQE